MKKFLKSMLVAMLIIPIAFTLVACGDKGLDTKADVDIDGNYKTATIEDVNTYATSTAKDSESFNSGFRMTMKMTMPTATEGVTATTEINALAVLENKTIKGSAYKMSVVKGEDKIITEAYLKDSVTYMKASHGSDVVTYQEKIDTSGDFGYIEAAMESIDFKTGLEEISASAKVSVEKATSGKYTKWHVVVEETLTTYDTYYVFKSDSLVGIVVKQTFGTMTMEMNIEAYSGSIKYPSDLSTYSTEAPKAEWLEEMFS